MLQQGGAPFRGGGPPLLNFTPFLEPQRVNPHIDVNIPYSPPTKKNTFCCPVSPPL